VNVRGIEEDFGCGISVAADRGDAEIYIDICDDDGNYQFLPLRELVSELLELHDAHPLDDLPKIAQAFRAAAERLEGACASASAG